MHDQSVRILTLLFFWGASIVADQAIAEINCLQKGVMECNAQCGKGDAAACVIVGDRLKRW